MPTESIEDQLLDQPRLIPDYTVVCPECKGAKIIAHVWGDYACRLCKGVGRVSDILAGQHERIGN